MLVKTCLLVALLSWICSVTALASPAENAAASGQAENIGKHDKAFKMSPQDKSYGSNQFDEKGKKNKFNTPTNVPAGDSTEDEDVTDSPKGQKEPVILNDYDPNRLGVSEEDAASDDNNKRQPKPAAAGKVSSSSSEESSPDKADPKSGLSTGKGEGSGGVGAGRDDQEPGRAGDAAGESAAKSGTSGKPLGSTSTSVGAYGSRSSAGTKSEKDIDESWGGYGRVLVAATMIILSELGDKTFFIAALMAMRHQPFFVFTASFSSLAIMTLLSAFLGMVLPSLLSKEVTTLLAAILFLVFGVRLLREGYAMDPNAGAQDELDEVEQELDFKDTSDAQDLAEKGGKAPSSSGSATKPKPLEGLTNLASLIISPLWIQIFVMTFLAEWGDRSQIATVAMSAGHHFWQVIIGGILGHGISTAIAVYGGKLLATRLSMRTITLGGSLCFFVFALIYAYDWFDGTD